jgi:pimeloyl-ACP methyl ester carboxylesterase
MNPKVIVYVSALLALLLAGCSPLRITPAPAAAGLPATLEGDWQGAITVPGKQLGIMVTFTSVSGELQASMDIPEQDTVDLPLHDVEAELPRVHFELLGGPNLAVLDGELGSDGIIRGQFAQSGTEGTFELTRLGADPEPTATPPGMASGLVDVGGHDLYYQCLGQGSPTVILEAGSGADSTYWAGVMRGVAGTTRVCAYDRANLGKSGTAPAPRTFLDMARDLHALLGKASIRGPYILAAHSGGGFIARLFVDQYPGEVAGLVLVDAAHPDMGPRLLVGLPPESPGEPESLGAWRQWFTWMSDSSAPAPFQDPEGMDNRAGLEQVRAARPLGDLPLVVISRSNDDTPLAEGWPPLPAETEGKLRQVWQDLQSDLVEISSNSTQVIAATGGHDLPGENPDLIIGAILKLVETARSR